MKGFQSKTDSHVQPSSKLGGSNLGANNTTSQPKGLAGNTTAQGDRGDRSLKGGAGTFAHETNGSNTVAAPAGGRQSAGQVSRGKAG